MAIFDIVTTGIDWDFGDLMGGEIVLRGPKTVEYTSASGFRIVLKGNGFKFDTAGLPVAGNVTVIEVFLGDDRLARYRELTTPLVQYHMLAFDSGAPADGFLLFEALRSGDDVINGGDDSGRLPGFDGNDRIYGNGGDDWLIGGRGVDSVYGGDGVNGVSFESDESPTHQGAQVDLQLGTDNVIDDGWGNTETATEIQNVRGTQWNDRLTGDGRPNLLIGLEGSDKLYGGDGDDTLDGTAADYRNQYGGGGDSDILYGGDGNDVLLGGLHTDSLFGGDGDDYLDAGEGRDVLDGGIGNDTLSFLSLGDEATGVTVDLSGFDEVLDDGYNYREDADGFENVIGSQRGDTLTGDNERNTLWGEGGNDLLTGGGNDDQLYGGIGNDEFNGGNGNDTMSGQAGRDRFAGDSGNDLVGFWDIPADGHGVVVDLARTIGDIRDDGFGNVESAFSVEWLEGSQFGDELSGDREANVFWGMDGKDTLSGGEGDDSLYGGADRDRIVGGSGFDILVGLDGLDVLTGGANADYFYFMGAAPGADAADRITDFEAGLDGLVISQFWAGDLPQGTTITAAQFMSGAGANAGTTSAHRVIYNTTTGEVFFDADGVGGEAAVLFATLDNHAALTWDRVFTVEPF